MALELNAMTMPIIIEFIGLLPFFVFIAIVLLKVRQLKKQERRDPITSELRHLPGSSLQEQLESVSDSRMDKMIHVILTGLMASVFISSRKIGEVSTQWNTLDTSAAVIAVGYAIYLAGKTAADLPKQSKLRQGIRAEHATAQELAASLAGENRVIHDIRCKDFNIDHVVITPAGVFAVETKSRQKLPTGKGATAVKVRYDGKQLEFPEWKETKPIEQAARQAKWLSDYLEQSTGTRFLVTPVVALPGWYVETTVRPYEGMVRVINPKKSQWLLLSEPRKLDSAAIQRATFAIEKLAQLAPDAA